MKVAVAKTPKKKRSKAPLVILIIFLIFFIGPIALFYGLFYDPASKKVVLQDDISLANIGNRIIVDSLDYAPTEQQIKVVVSENDIDNVLHVAMQKITEKTKFVKKAYMYVKGNSYNFFMDVDGVIIKTRVKVSTKMEVSPDGQNFIFKVTDISLGRVSGIMKPAKMLINRYVTDEKINEVLAATGMNMTFDREQYAIIYPKASLLGDLSKLTNDTEFGLYFDVMQTMLADDMMEFVFDGNNVIEGVVDLTQLETNELVTDDAAHIKVQSEQVQEIRDQLSLLIEHKDIDTTNKLVPVYAFDFLFSGWEALAPEGKELLADVDFSYIDINEKETYKGFDLYNSEAKLVDKMKDTVNANALINKSLNPRYKDLCTLNESAINDYIAGRNLIGYSSLLYRKGPDGFKVNYITIENFYMNIYKNSDNKNIAEMVCKIDVNGYPTSLTFYTEMSDSGFADNKLVFEIKEIRFGQNNAENLKEEFFDIIYDALNNEGDSSLQADKENYTISVDFTNIMQYACEEAERAIELNTGRTYDLDTYFSMSNLTFDILGSSRDDEGAMKLTLINPIEYDD